MRSARREREFAARALIARLCVELGAPAELARELDCSALATIAASLRLPEHTARVVALDAASLSDLVLPALAAVDGALAIVRQVGAREVSLELAGGATQTLTRGAFVAGTLGSALELRPSLAREGRFVARLAAFLGRTTGDLCKLSLASLLSSLLALCLPLATGLVVDRALPDRAPKLLALVAGGIFLVSLQRALFSWLEQRVALSLQGKLELAVESRLFDHVLRTPYAELAGPGVGGWLETLRGAQKVQDVLTEALLARVFDLALFIACGVAIARQHLGVALALAVSGLLLGVVALVFGIGASRLEQARIACAAREDESLHELIDGVLTWRTTGAQRRGVLRWLERLLDARVSAVHIDRQEALARMLLGALRDAIGVGTFVWAAYACMEAALSVGALLSVVMLAERFVAATAQLTGLIAPVLTARTHLGRIDRLLALPDVTRDREVAQLGRAHAGDAVVLDDVWFRYGPDQPWILEGYSLRVPAGTQFALSGPSGMGKSTILRLVAGLYTPERGSVRVFGRAPHTCASEIAYLPQQTHLFEGSIQQNLKLLSGGASDEALAAAAEESGLADFVATLPMGYETVLPPGGATLSGGQRQLVAWTAAMASARAILLLDEALAQVDRIARTRLLGMCRARTCTTISVEHAQSGL